MYVTLWGFRGEKKKSNTKRLVKKKSPSSAENGFRSSPLFGKHRQVGRRRSYYHGYYPRTRDSIAPARPPGVEDARCGRVVKSIVKSVVKSIVKSIVYSKGRRGPPARRKRSRPEFGGTRLDLQGSATFLIARAAFCFRIFIVGHTDEKKIIERNTPKHGSNRGNRTSFCGPYEFDS